MSERNNIMMGSGTQINIHQITWDTGNDYLYEVWRKENSFTNYWAFIGIIRDSIVSLTNTRAMGSFL